MKKRSVFHYKRHLTVTRCNFYLQARVIKRKKFTLQFINDLCSPYLPTDLFREQRKQLPWTFVDPFQYQLSETLMASGRMFYFMTNRFTLPQCDRVSISSLGDEWVKNASNSIKNLCNALLEFCCLFFWVIDVFGMIFIALQFAEELEARLEKLFLILFNFPKIFIILKPSWILLFSFVISNENWIKCSQIFRFQLVYFKLY